MSVPLSICSYISWYPALQVLGLNPESTVLPCTVVCPIKDCKGQLLLYHDTETKGLWSYCRKCKFAGDLIELASAMWDDLDILNTVKKLVSIGVEIPEECLQPHYIENYAHWYPHRCKRMQDLWKLARSRLPFDKHTALRELKYRLGIRLSMDNERWLNGPGLLFGGTHKSEVEKAFSPLTGDRLKKSTNAGANRVFVGPNWEDLIIIPMMDLPGRIKSFIFYGRLGRIPQDMFCRPIAFAKRHDDDCGIAFYPIIDSASEDLFVMADPMLALKLHCTHFHDYSVHAPLVSIYAKGPIRTSIAVWTHIQQRPIFWGPPLPEIFENARASDGTISFIGFDNDGPTKTFMRTPLNEWLTKVKADARPWRTALEEQLNILPTKTAETILLNMKLDDTVLQDILAKCPSELQASMVQVNNFSIAKRIDCNKFTIKEHNGWFLDNNNELISDAILRIEQAIHFEKLKKTFYAGNIIFNEKKIPFYELSSIIEADTFHWMRNVLLKAEAGFMNFSNKWNDLALYIANKFHPPKLVTGISKIGWDDSVAAFVFPSYLITNKGDVVSDSRVFVMKKRTPALQLEKPTQLTAEEVAEFPSGDGAGVFWAVTACIAANILAPIFGHKPCGIGLVGDVAELTGYNTAKMLGCAEYSVISGSKPGESLSDVCNEHNWPIFLKPPKSGISEWVEWYTNDEHKNCITPINWYAAKVLTTDDKWNIIEAGHYVAQIKINEVVRKILPSFLQYVARQYFKIKGTYPTSDGPSFAYMVLVWLSQWYASIGGDHVVVTNAIKMSNFGATKRKKRATEAFIDLVCRLYDDDEIDLERAGFIPEKKKIWGLICFPGKDGALGEIFIPSVVIDKCLVDHKAPTLVTDVVPRCKYAGLSGWKIDEETWNKRLHQWRTWNRYKLRVAD